MARGRPKGSPNKSSNCVKELAAPYGREALEYLASTMRNKDAKDVDRIASAKELLDRGYGRAVQAVKQEGPTNVIITIRDERDA